MEIIKLKDYLKSTDYKAIQFLEGEITAEEFEPIKQKRHEAREKIRQLSGTDEKGS